MKSSEEETAHTVLDREWLTAAETLNGLNKSQSTVDRLVAAKELASKVEPRAGRKPERLYKAEDVHRIAKAAGETSRALRVVRPPGQSQLAIAPEAISSLREVTTEWGKGAVSSLRDLMTEWHTAMKSPRLAEKLWLTVKEASEYSGIPPGYVKRLSKEGKLEGQQFGRSWRIRRASLEAM